jgi:mitotic spindle assembly checkpoint protein MAD2
VLTSTDDGLLNYLNQVMEQMESWLLDGDVQRLVVVVSGVDSGETLERWQFNVKVDEKKGSITGTAETGDENQIQNVSAAAPKTVKEIHNEIQAIIRQITASVCIVVF